MKLLTSMLIVSALALAVAAGRQARDPVLVSDSGRADEAVRRCLMGPSALSSGDAEPHAAANPGDADHLVAAWQTSGPNGSVIQAAASFDGGVTWTGPRGVPISGCAGGPIAGASRGSDPWVAIDPRGRAYVGALAWEPGSDGAPDPVNALVVAASADGGRTWSAARVVARAEPGFQHDNVGLTADPTRPGHLYVATTRYQQVDSSTYGPVAMSRSTDGGRTWEPLRTVTPDVRGERISAPQIVVDPRNGVLHLGYYRARRGEAVVGVRRSNDGGLTWGEESVAAPFVRGAREELNPLTGRRAPLAGDIVQLAVDPADGAVFVAYADARLDPGGRLGVSLVWSADGRVWSAPIAVSEPGGLSAWLPGVAVRGREVGVLHLSADLRRTDTGLAPVTVHHTRFQRGDAGTAGLVPIARTVVDRANYAWPGDYHALVATRSGFRAIYARSTLGATERFPPGDRDPRTANSSDVFAY